MIIFFINLGNTYSYKVVQCNKSSMNFLLVLLFLSVKDLGVSIPYVMSLQRAKRQIILAAFLLVEVILFFVI